MKTANKVKKNRPDITIWDTQKKICQIVEVSLPLDMNLSQVREGKESKYLPLITQMQQMYNNYRIEVIPVLVGALGSIPHGLKTEPTRNWNRQSENRDCYTKNPESSPDWIS